MKKPKNTPDSSPAAVGGTKKTGEKNVTKHRRTSTASPLSRISITFLLGDLGDDSDEAPGERH